MDTAFTHIDDVWELDCDEAGSQRLDGAELEREWQTRRSQFHNLGYRDGIEAGKNSTVQAGFNLGYKEATPAGYNWGVSKGAISAFALLPTSAQEALVPELDSRARLQALRSVLNSLSSADALRYYYEDTVQLQSTEMPEPLQQEAHVDGVADALRGLNILRVDTFSTSIGTQSRPMRRLEELERQARTELMSNSIELSSSNGLLQ